MSEGTNGMYSNPSAAMHVATFCCASISMGAVVGVLIEVSPRHEVGEIPDPIVTGARLIAVGLSRRVVVVDVDSSWGPAAGCVFVLLLRLSSSPHTLLSAGSWRPTRPRTVSPLTSGMSDRTVQRCGRCRAILRRTATIGKTSHDGDRFQILDQFPASISATRVCPSDLPQSRRNSTTQLLASLNAVRRSRFSSMKACSYSM